MRIKAIVIILAIVGLFTSTSTTLVEEVTATAAEEKEDQEESSEAIKTNGNGMYTQEGFVLSKYLRPSNNPDFEPDESCLFDVFQLQCVPGSEQECPEGFVQNDLGTCFPHDFSKGISSQIYYG